MEIPIGNIGEAIQIEYKKNENTIKFAYLMSRCWGNIDCLKKKKSHQSLPLLLLKKTLILTELPYYIKSRREGFINISYRWGIMFKSKSTKTGEWENIKLQFMVLPFLSVVRESVQPQWAFLLQPFHGCPFVNFLSKSIVATHSASTSKWIRKNKIHRFSINSCSSSWRCWGKVQREAPEKPPCWLIWLA